jgi:hypothetical protein
MKALKIAMSLIGLLFSMAATSQDSTITTHKSTHVHVHNGGTVKHVVKHRKHYRIRKHTTYRTPANSRTTKITTTTTHTDKK